MYDEILGKTVLITGGSRGIGKGIVMKLLSLGARVISVSANTFISKKEISKNLINGKQLVQIKFDLQDISKLVLFKSLIIDYLPDIDILINNAGIKVNSGFFDSTLVGWNKTMQINLQAPYFISQMVSEYMKSKNSGIIINIASQSGVSPVSTSVEYGLSKSGVIYLTKSLAKILAPYGIRVNALSPGRTYSDQTNYKDNPEKEAVVKTQIPLGVINTPDDIAEVLVFLLSKYAKNITGQVIGVDGGERIV